MRFDDTPLNGAKLVCLDPRADDRGFFARAWCSAEMEAARLNGTVAQANIAFTAVRGTVRGMHYQEKPHTEAKLLRCIAGSVFDVIVDVRQESATFGQWFGVELTARNRLALYVPEGFAHGYQALEDSSEVLYFVTTPYTPTAERGLRYDDPGVGISWPLPVVNVSPKDLAWPRLEARDPVGAR